MFSHKVMALFCCCTTIGHEHGGGGQLTGHDHGDMLKILLILDDFVVVVVVEMVPIVMVCYHGCSLLVAEVAGRGWPSRRLVVVVLVVAMADRNDGWSLVNGHLVQSCWWLIFVFIIVVV